MNKTQLEYAVRRLDQAWSDKVREIQAKNQKKEKPFDGEALFKAIKSGKLKLSRYYATREVTQYTDVSQVCENLDDFITKDKQPDDTLTKPINDEYQRIKDQLYLGDAKEALAMIEAFAAKKF